MSDNNKYISKFGPPEEYPLDPSVPIDYNKGYLYIAHVYDKIYEIDVSSTLYWIYRKHDPDKHKLVMFEIKGYIRSVLHDVEPWLKGAGCKYINKGQLYRIRSKSYFRVVNLLQKFAECSRGLNDFDPSKDEY